MYLPEKLSEVKKDPTLYASRLFLAFGCGALVLYVVPAKLILEASFFGTAIEWMAFYIPSISRWEELSTFPESTRIFAAFIFCLVPIQTFLIARSKSAQKSFERKEVARSFTRLTLNFSRVFVLAFLFIFLGMQFAIVDTPPCRVCVNDSKLALLLIGVIYSTTVSTLLAVCIWYLSIISNSFRNQGEKNV